jgi:RimJ/RimL family protein N-acetyltransferase
LDDLSLPGGYSASVWWPSLGRPWPSGASDLRTRVRFAFRYILDCAGLFSNREVGALCIHYGDRLVHYSGFTPRYWRFPFLPDQDLQIGDTWTDPAHRGKGLAAYALEQILEIKQKLGRGFWYVVAKNNFPSIRVVEKAGFSLIAIGDWNKPFGIKLLGSYVMEVATDEVSPATPVIQVEAIEAPLEVPSAPILLPALIPSIEPVLTACIEPAVPAVSVGDSMPKRTAA